MRTWDLTRLLIWWAEHLHNLHQYSSIDTYSSQNAQWTFELEVRVTSSCSLPEPVIVARWLMKTHPYISIPLLTSPCPRYTYAVLPCQSSSYSQSSDKPCVPGGGLFWQACTRHSVSDRFWLSTFHHWLLNCWLSLNVSDAHRRVSWNCQKARAEEPIYIYKDSQWPDTPPSQASTCALSL